MRQVCNPCTRPPQLKMGLRASISLDPRAL